MARHGKELTTEQKECFYHYHIKGFRATKFRNLLELTVEQFRNFLNGHAKGEV